MWSALRPTVSSSSTTRASHSARRLGELVDHQRLADDRADRHARVERRVRILEDDLHVARAARAARRLSSAVTSLPSNQTSPEVGSIRRRMQRPVVRLAAARLADQRRASRPRARSKLDAVDRVHARRPRGRAQPPRDREVLDEVLDLRAAARRHAHAPRSPVDAGSSKMQRTLWPGAGSRSAGVAATHSGIAYGQRAREAAAGRPARSASAPCPGSARAAPCAAPPCRCAGSSGAGPACRDGAGARTAPRRVASSTTLPAYITTTRCATSATTPRSCVISMIAMPSALLQLGEQVEDLRLDRHVERGRRLVGDQQLRVAGERHRDHHALAHAARELVRVVVDAPLRRRDADQREHLDRALDRRLAAQALVQAQRLGDLLADRVDRVERGHRLLEDHRDLLAADAAHLVVARA